MATSKSTKQKKKPRKQELTDKKASDDKKKYVGSLFGENEEITTVEVKLNNSEEYGL